MIELTADDLEIIDDFDIPMPIIDFGGKHWGVVTPDAFTMLLIVLDAIY